MDLQEVGDLLKGERERQGLSVAEMVERTKISRANLTALEHGDSDNLPHPVYVKGFVRNYAHELGLDDPEGLSRSLEMDIPEFEHPDPDRGEEDLGNVYGIPERRLPVLIMGAVLALAVAVGGYFLITSDLVDTLSSLQNPFGTQEQSAPAETQPEVSEPEQPMDEAPEVTPEATLETSAEPEASPAVQPEMPAAPQAEVLPEAAPEPEAAVEPEPEQTEQTSRSGQADQAEPEPVPSGPTRVVVITATGECWTRATTASGSTRTRFLQPGQTMTVEFVQGLEVRLGNAGAVTMTLDGEPFEFNGRPGQVRTVTLP